MSKDFPGLLCQKSHSHDREIVDCSREPVRARLTVLARAVRLVQRLYNIPSWTLWNQSKITPELLARVNALARISTFAYSCSCGAEKPRALSAIKLDAAQFFEAPSVKRSVRRIKPHLDDVQQRLGFNAIAVQRGA